METLTEKYHAIFLDKDGVINKLDKKKHYQNTENLVEGTVKFLKKINKSGYCPQF